MSEFQTCDVVVLAGDKDTNPKIVVEVDIEKGKITVISTSPNHKLTMSTNPHVDAVARRWSDCGLRTTMSRKIYSIGDGDDLEEHDITKAIRLKRNSYHARIDRQCFSPFGEKTYSAATATRL